jgi:hypothetical protein
MSYRRTPVSRKMGELGTVPPFDKLRVTAEGRVTINVMVSQPNHAPFDRLRVTKRVSW